MNELVLVLNFGGQYSHTLARKVRELGVYCEVIPHHLAKERIAEKNPNAVLSCGQDEAHYDIPCLYLYGDKTYRCTLNQEDSIQIEAKPSSEALQEFLFDICKFSKSWDMQTYAQTSIATLKEKIGDKKVLCALSGGVDSTVCAVMMQRAVGNQLTCIFVDHGLLRKNEADDVTQICAEFGINLVHVDAETRFLSKLAGVSDPEQKRKIIGEEFIRVFEDEAKKIGKVDFLVQGTIYPDIIESGASGTAVIKSHHNVGGLPDVVDFEEIIEPVRLLFKDEVRAVGKTLGIAEDFVMRQPFPGPGLAVRVIGDLTKEKLDILRDADAIFREEIFIAGLHKTIKQYFAVLTNIRSVGIRDGVRTYDYTVGLRAVSTGDFMSANFVHLPYEVIGRVSARITSEVQGVNRVVYDVTNKPPSTIEWE